MPTLQRPERERRFSVLVGDITLSRAQAIVNASDETLSGGGGVDAAIHAAAGPALAAACAALAPCPTGEVRLTPGFRLAAEYVIQTAGPVWRDGKHGEPALLAACYRNALRLCEERGIETVDFPSISTGVFRYPVSLAAAVAEKAIMEHLRAHALPRRVRMVCRREETAALYRQTYNLWYAEEKKDRL